MSLCSLCQQLLARIVLYQLGEVSSVSAICCDRLGQAVPWKPSTTCIVCRLFSTNLQHGKLLEVRRTAKAVSRSAKDRRSPWPQDTSLVEHVDLFPRLFPDPPSGLVVELLNDSTLLNSAPSFGEANSIVVKGPILSHPGLFEPQKQYDCIVTSTRWLSECVESHEQCRRQGSYANLLPKRILDLSKTQGLECIRLVHGDLREARYAVLSHCWGAGGGFTTTKESLSQRESNIDVKSMPKLFQDAVHIARDLGVQYLWLDALCIIQDDWREWETEAANMADIFRNAYVTLAATAAPDASKSMYANNTMATLRLTRPSALDPGEGAGGAPTAAMEEITWNFTLHPRANPVIDILQAPLNRRGWVLQELMLSRRTLHFGKHQLLWHCKELAASEDGTFKNEKGIMSNLGWYYGPDVRLIPQPDEPQLATPSASTSLPLVRRARRSEAFSAHTNSPSMQWWRLVEEYSERLLTFQSDKLVALAGIAQIMREQLQDEYVAGLWRRDLVESLLWCPSNIYSEIETPSAISSIPSWSWASLDQGVRMPEGFRRFNMRFLLDVVDVKIQMAGESPASQVLGGDLVVLGDPLVVQYDKSFGRMLSLYAVKDQAGKDVRTQIGNGSYDSKEPPPDNIWALPVSLDTPNLNVLLLEQVLGEDHRYRRLGIGVLQMKYFDTEFYDTRLAKKTRLTII